MKYLLTFALALIAFMPLAVSAQQLSDFEPITAIPVFDSVADVSGGNLSTFFNGLYVLCVGAAAVVAIAQIMIAGFRLATAGGSHSAVEEARGSIQNSILGLLLVLSPTIVFGIINPDILNLSIDTSVLNRGTVTVPSDATTPTDTNSVQVNLSGNKWGALDNKCDFEGGSWLETIGGFSTYNPIGIKTLGNGSVSQGRQCCKVAGGEIGQNETGIEVCSLSSLIEEGRYVAHIKGTMTYERVGGDGIPTQDSAEFHFFTSGAGSGNGLYGDIDTIAIHGFRTLDTCNTFVNNLTESSLTTIYRGGLAEDGYVGLLEGRLEGFGSSAGEVFPRSTLVTVNEIRSRTCDKITYRVR